ncbi:MAG: peptidase M14 [Gemmatimonadetes bacterium]|nr:peptidase M14 [Gemmatimonadota bacterium]MBK7785031.1 peptidase M14 [Gemmatimonadota bacterium]
MPRHLLRSLPLAAFALALAGPARLTAQSTRPERTGGAETSSYADVTGFLDSLARRSRDLRLGVLGTSPEGRAIPWVLAARPMVEGPAAAARSGKPVIYLQGNIHSGEVEGKEAAQMLLRDLAVGPLSRLLDSVIVLVVPIYNIDGNEKFGPGERHRPGQNGPAVVGPSLNGQGLNLNRDYVKLEAPETRAAYALLAAWDPDVFIDLHTTNGSYHGYALTWSPGLNPNGSPANDYVRDRFLPAVRERLRRRHQVETFPYGNFRSQHRDSLAQGWETYDARPRFGTNAMGVRGRLAILSEGYSNDPFPTRIRATYLFLREILSLAAEERATIRRVVAATDRWRPDSIALRSVLAPPHVEEVIAELTDDDGDGSHGFARRRRSGAFQAIRMPVYDRFVPAAQVARPAGYLLPPGYGHLVSLLRQQGVLVERLRDPWSGPAARFRVDSLQVAPFVFEGHRTVTVHGAWGAPEAATAAPGWYWVSTDQRLGTFAACVLEPGSEDGYATWNLLDRDLRRGATLPFFRLASPLAIATELLP